MVLDFEDSDAPDLSKVPENFEFVGVRMASSADSDRNYDSDDDKYDGCPYCY